MAGQGYAVPFFLKTSFVSLLNANGMPSKIIMRIKWKAGKTKENWSIFNEFKIQSRLNNTFNTFSCLQPKSKTSNSLSIIFHQHITLRNFSSKFTFFESRIFPSNFQDFFVKSLQWTTDLYHSYYVSENYWDVGLEKNDKFLTKHGILGKS